MAETLNGTLPRSIFTLNENSNMIWIGISYMSISLFAPPLLIMIMTSLHNKNLKSTNVSYKLMNFINFCLLGQSTGHFVTAPALIYPGLQERFDVIIRIIGGTMNTLWICDLPIVAILAVCRTLIFSNLIHTHKFPNIISITLFLTLSWIFVLFVYSVVFRNMELYPPGWGYDFEVPFCHLFDTLEISLSFPCLIVSYLSYISIAYLIFVKKNMKSSVRSRKSEISILLQSTFVTTYISGMLVVWHPALFTMLSFIDMTDITNQAILNGCWIIHCYVNPIMLLILNKSIREDCFRFLRIRTNAPAPSRTIMLTTISLT